MSMINITQRALQLMKGTEDAVIEQPTPAEVQAVANPIHSMSHEQRMDLLKRLAKSAGLRLPKTILPEGTALWDIGERNKRQLQDEINALPNFTDAAAAMLARIEQEQPEDYKGLPLNGFVMDPKTGRIYGNEDVDAAGNPLSDALFGYTNPGFEHWISFLKPPHLYGNPASFMLSMSPKVRAQVFNEMSDNAQLDKLMTLRTIVEPVSGLRTIRAVTSGKHSLETGDDAMILNSIAENEPTLVKAAKARLTREHHRSEFELIWPAMDRQLAVGDIALIGVRITNSEVKAGSLRVEVFVLRILCANFTTAYSKDDKEEIITIKHVGDLRTKLVDALGRALKRAEPFVQAFGDAYKLWLPSGMSRGDVLLRTRKALELPEDLMLRAASLWDADGDKVALHEGKDTLAGLVNAMTRASQEQETEKAADVERKAGRLILEGWKAIGVAA